MEMTDKRIEALLAFCCTSANTPLIIDEWYRIGKISVGIEGVYNPNDGNMLDLMVLAFNRFFHGFRAEINTVPDDDGYHRYSARMTARTVAKIQ